MGIVSAIVPARNEEANIARVVQSLAAQPEIDEIIVVDDQSTDRTPAILADLAARYPQLKTLRAPAPPPGWLGKTHALWLGAAQARCEWLLFTDADTEHLPGSTARALADAARHDAELVSYSPEQEMHTWWEYAVIPFIFCRLAAHFAFDRVSDPLRSEAAANGQFLLIRRGTYDLVNGHRAVAAQVLEDLELARFAKRAGKNLWFAPGQGMVGARMYRSFAALWEGWRKNLFLLVGASSAAVLREMFFALHGLILLPLTAFDPLWLIPAAGVLLQAHFDYAFTLRQNQFPVMRVVWLMPGSLLYAAMLAASAAAHARGVVAWKGREYPVASR
jgi:glycosyltransferase involved in cell wall biosynthesis